MNFMIGGSGHIFRAIQLKKEKINYTEFVTINYVIYTLILFINLFLFMCFFYFFSKEKIILLGLIFILFVLYILLIPKIYKFILNKIKTFNNNFYKIIKRFFVYLIKHLTKKKNLINFFYFFLIIFFLMGCIIFLISSNILNTQNILNILQLFFIIFYLNKIIYVNNFIGVNELIAGLLAETMGYYFLQGALIQLIFRISIYLGCMLNYLLYFAIKFKK